jgi:hypothetical protein
MLAVIDTDGWENESISDDDLNNDDETGLSNHERVGPGVYGLEFDIEDEHDLGENHKLHLLLEAKKKKEEEETSMEIENEIKEKNYMKQLQRHSLNSLNTLMPLVENLTEIVEKTVVGDDDEVVEEVDEYGFKKKLLTQQQKNENEFIKRMCEEKKLVLNLEDKLMKDNFAEIERNKKLLIEQTEKELKLKLELENSQDSVTKRLSTLLPSSISEALKLHEYDESNRKKLIKISKREKKRRLKIEAALAAKKDIEDQELKVANLESAELREHKRLARMARLGMMVPKIEELEDTSSESSDNSGI